MSVIQAGNTTTTSLIYTGDTTGNLVFTTGGANTVALTLANTQAATFAGAVTVTGTLTATGGVVQGANAAPLFSVTASTNQSIPNGTQTKIAFDTKVYDTNTNYSTTNYRFTPTVAGYYQFNSAVFAATGSARPIISLYKNGSAIFQTAQVSTSTDGGGNIILSCMTYANGSTDYFEIYYQQSTGGSVSINSNGLITYFQGFLARSA